MMTNYLVLSGAVPGFRIRCWTRGPPDTLDLVQPSFWLKYKHSKTSENKLDAWIWDLCSHWTSQIYYMAHEPTTCVC